MKTSWGVALAFLWISCGDDARPPDAGIDLPAWDRGLPAAGEAMGVRRGLTPIRGILHLHSPYSHDACDGAPRDEQTGALDEACLADQREALCALRIDYASLTEHDDSMADEAFSDLLLQRENDELVLGSAGAPIANRVRCPSGHEAILFTGGENDLMPVMIEQHPEGTVAERHDFYNASDAAAVSAFRDVGGLVVIPHSEQRPLASIEALAPDGMEIYNLHANIDPDIRVDFLGLDASGAIRAIGDFADTRPEGPEPDLALIAFLEPSTVALDRWDALLGQGLRIFGTAGTDAHQNALPIELRDGERGDSYRRMMRWFGNVALATDPSDPLAIKAAIAAGRSFVVFELFGTPSGFDARAEGAVVTELGGELLAADAASLRITVPSLFAHDEGLPAPAIRARVLRVDGQGASEVASGAGPELTVPLGSAGAYRVEVLITPRHLGPYLGVLGTALAEREFVWIYANPIYVR